MTQVEVREIEGFPDYVVDKAGQVYTAYRLRPRRASLTRHGAVKITLFRDGKPYTRSLALIVARAWVWNNHDPEIFDTPIHLDNDSQNNHADNLAWRPRWFAVRYQQQYWNLEFRNSKTEIVDVKTEEIWPSIMSVCQAYGLLFSDVFQSCTKGDKVFPSWKTFRFVSTW